MVSPSLYVEVDGQKLGLDNGYYESAFLSHAHSDHTKGIKKVKKLLSSNETRHLLSLKNDTFSSKYLKMRNAGHMLGARQLVAEEDGLRTVYTGDIRIKNGIIEEGAEIIECDKLIIEATFSSSIFSFPDPFEVYEEIAKSIAVELLKGNSIAFGAYPLGKAQEIIKVVNEYLGIPVLVDKKVALYSSKYAELGISLDFEELGSENSGELTRESFVYVTSPSNLKREKMLNLAFEYGMPFKMFYATGWVRKFRFSNYHKVFPLSDHADFRDLLYYIENSGAREVVIFGGEIGDILHYKNKKGISVKISKQ